MRSSESGGERPLLLDSQPAEPPIEVGAIGLQDPGRLGDVPSAWVRAAVIRPRSYSSSASVKRAAERGAGPSSGEPPRSTWRTAPRVDDRSVQDDEALHQVRQLADVARPV